MIMMMTKQMMLEPNKMTPNLLSECDSAMDYGIVRTIAAPSRFILLQCPNPTLAASMTLYHITVVSSPVLASGLTAKPSLLSSATSLAASVPLLHAQSASSALYANTSPRRLI
jgi:hypothetical protein